MFLKFSKGNAKLDGNKKVIYTFSLPAGRTCPGAMECKSMAVAKADKETGVVTRSIKDGPHCRFRCFAASQEVLYKNTYNQRAYNLGALKAAKGMRAKANLIHDSLPAKAEYVRVHVSGDFYSQEYFNAWMEVAYERPDVTFYAYTKSIPFWVNYGYEIPHNFVLTASVGGKYDPLIGVERLRSATVVFTEAEADKLGLKIDHDDSLAMNHGPSFALLLHGTQPKGTEAAKAWKEIKATVGGYSKAKARKTKKLKVTSA